MKSLLSFGLLLVLSSSALAFFPPSPPPNYYHEEQETDPSRPNQPANRIISNSVRYGKDKQTEKEPKTSGDFFDGLRLSTVYTRTSFDDHDVNSSGEVDELGFYISGNLGENTTLTLGYTNISYKYTLPSPDTKTHAHGYEAILHHNLSENYGIGVYGFYQDIDIDNQNPNTYSYGGGLLFTTFHELGPVNLATSHTLTYVDYDTNDDYIYVGLIDISKDITDWFGVGVNTSWTDSLSDNAENSDDNYWTVGADLRFYWESFSLSVGYEKTLKLSDYEDNTLQVSLTYSF